VGRPAELRARLFQNALVVKTTESLRDPGSVFGDIDSVTEWHDDGPGTYVLTVSDRNHAAPEVTRRLVAAGANVLSLSESQHSLEDVYLALVESDVEVLAP